MKTATPVHRYAGQLSSHHDFVVGEGQVIVAAALISGSHYGEGTAAEGLLTCGGAPELGESGMTA